MPPIYNATRYVESKALYYTYSSYLINSLFNYIYRIVDY